ncbi:hypothetical protein INT82_01940 [Mannheimia haemolytica]|nr:hypothetical protein [Mannheimia haemolytica]
MEQKLNNVFGGIMFKEKDYDEYLEAKVKKVRFLLLNKQMPNGKRLLSKLNEKIKHTQFKKIPLVKTK